MEVAKCKTPRAGSRRNRVRIVCLIDPHGSWWKCLQTWVEALKTGAPLKVEVNYSQYHVTISSIGSLNIISSISSISNSSILAIIQIGPRSKTS